MLRAAEQEFDGFITADKNLEFQQNLGKFRIAILVLPGANWPELRPFGSHIAAAVDQLQPGELKTLQIPTGAWTGPCLLGEVF